MNPYWKRVKLLFFHINRFLYKFMLLAALLSIAHLVVLLFFGWGNSTVIYWLAMSQTLAWKLAIPLFVVCAAYFLLNVALFPKLEDKILEFYAALMVVLSIITGAFLCGTLYLGVWQTGLLGYRQHVTAVRLNNYTYNLQFYSSDFAETYTHRYDLYACLFNTFCKEIYSVPESNGITSDIETIALETEPLTNTLYVQINGSIAFNYQQNPVD